MRTITIARSSVVASTLLAVFVGMAAIAACQGAVGGGSPAETSSSQSGSNGAASGQQNSGGAASSAGTTAGSGGTTTPPAPGQALAPESAGPMVMRRVTNREYSNMMADLLSDTTNPGLTFPSDGPSATGFEAPNSVADLNVQYYFQTADKLVETALQNGKLSIPCQSPLPTAEMTCAGQFVSTFGQRAFRRPVAPAEQNDLLGIFTTARGLNYSFTESLAQVAKAMIQSPNFLYHWEIGPTAPTVDKASGLVPLTPWQVASRLALMLWESAPDDVLLSAAESGQLSTPAQIQTQAQRMLADARSSRALYDFHLQWLLQVAGNVTDLKELVKTSPLFTPAVAQALGTEFTTFLTNVYATGDGTFNTLLTAPYSYINSALGPIYGVNVAGTGFSQVQLDPTKRAGILTQPAFLAAQADPGSDNPVRRGLAVYVNMLCGLVGPVPAVVPAVQPPSATTTTRQRFDVHAQNACAQGCHTLFDPPGFAFENYDAVGAYRTTESGQAVDSSGTFTTPGGATISFKNAVDLAKQLGTSSEAQYCVDRQWLRYVLGRSDTSADQGSLELAYRAAGKTPGYSLRDMLYSLVTSKAFLYRTPSAGESL